MTTTDIRIDRIHNAEHGFHRAVALLETLGVLIECNFTSMDDVNVDQLNMLAVQYQAGIDQLRLASKELYPGLSEEQLAALRAEADPSAAYHCGYAAGLRDAGNVS